MKPLGKLSLVAGLMLCGALMMAVPACGGDKDTSGATVLEFRAGEG
jgi:hypothetical protein